MPAASSVPIRSSTAGGALARRARRCGSEKTAETGPRAASPAETSASAAPAARTGRRAGQQGAHERPRPVPGRGADATPATSSSSSAMSRRRASVRAGAGAPRAAPPRGASASPRALPPPPSTRESRAPSRRSLPSRASTATTAARTEKSGSPEVLEVGQRVQVGVAREVQQRFRAHLQVGVVQQGLDPRHHRAVAGLASGSRARGGGPRCRRGRGDRAPQGGWPRCLPNAIRSRA